MPGSIEDWPQLAKYADQIDRFTKFTERFYFITKDDRVYAFGRQTVGAISNIIDNDTGPEPVEIPGLRGKKIVKFAFCLLDILALSADGTVWALKLGPGNTVDAYQAVQVEAIRGEDAVDIACGASTYSALNRNGALYVFRHTHKDVHGGGFGIFNAHAGFWELRDFYNLTSIKMTFEGAGLGVHNDSRLAYKDSGDYSFDAYSFHSPSGAVSIVPTFNKLFILNENGYIHAAKDKDDYDHFEIHEYYRNPTKPIYTGPMQFKALYGDPMSEPSYLIGRALDDQLYVIKATGNNPDSEVDEEAPRPLFTDDIVHAFAMDNPSGSLPFMVKLACDNSGGLSPRISNLMFDNQATSDTEFHLGNRTIYVHRGLLISRSNYMLRQFATAWRAMSSITIPDYSYHIYQLYLRYIYTGPKVILDQLRNTPSDVIGLYVVAANVQDEQLKQSCSEFLLKTTNTTTNKL